MLSMNALMICIRKFLFKKVRTYALIWIRMPLNRLMFEYLIFSWWDCLGRIRRYGLVGRSMSLGVGFDDSNLCLSLSLCLLVVD